MAPHVLRAVLRALFGVSPNIWRSFAMRAESCGRRRSYAGFQLTGSLPGSLAQWYSTDMRTATPAST